MADVMPALNQFDLVSRDIDAAVVFYRLLGLDIPESAIWRSPTGAHHVDLHLPNAIVQDPDGNHVGIMSPPDPARWRGPPSI